MSGIPVFVPKKPFKPRSLPQNSQFQPRNPLSSSYANRSPLRRPIFQSSEIRQYSEYNPMQPPVSSHYKRTLSLVALNYPSINIDTIHQILIDGNLNLTDQVLENLCLTFKSLDDSSHPHHLTDIEISSYKSVECPKKEVCPDTYCTYFHYLGERRRVPVFYSEFLCPQYFNCPKGDLCDQSHNRIEQAYHPKRLSDFYQETEKIEKNPMNLNEMSLGQLEQLRNMKLKIKADCIKDLENRLIWATKLQKKFKCSDCRREDAMFVTKPCGHLLCENCKEDQTGTHCKSPCTYYSIKRV